MESTKINKHAESVAWYSENRSLFISLCRKIAELLSDVLEMNDFTYQSVTWRAKEVESFSEKARKPKYTDPTRDIHDLAGIRVITYVDSDIQKICSLIESLFVVDKDNSVDKTSTLGTDRVGYRSVHYICELPESRTSLPEYSKYKGKCFEIQVRSVLQHAWAEIEHDRNYKFQGKLPPDIQRRFAILAGLLEMADREFEALTQEIDRYALEVEQETKNGNLDIPVDNTSIREFLSSKYSGNFASNDTSEAIEELQLMGIHTLSDLNEIIPNDYLDRLSEYDVGDEVSNSSFTGVLRDFMIIHDWNVYFTTAWRQSWNVIDDGSLKMYESYGVPVSQVRKFLDGESEVDA